MSKLIIYVAGKPTMNGYRIREFKWSAEHNCYIYEGRELGDSEFNAVYAKALKTNEDLYPKVRVVGLGVAPVSIVQPPVPTPTVTSIANGATITTAHEITWQEAESVLRHLAPHRLKKPVGRPPKVQAAE